MKKQLGIALFICINITAFGQYKTASDYTVKTKAAIEKSQAKLLSAITGDCEGAIVLCGGVYTEETAPPGTGNIYEFTGGCNNGTETMSLWYTFTAQEAGTISFVLDPADDLDDYDWGLFDITTGGCAGIVAQDGSSPEVGCNAFGSVNGINGPTGVSSANGGTGTSNGPGDLNGPAFNADIQAVAGQIFALVVMNWSNSQNGYSIDFTQSTASIYDNIVPEFLAVDPQCGNTSFTVTFSEPLVTSSVQVQDFNLITPDGIIIPFDTISAANPGASSEIEFFLSLENGLTQTGSYTVSITNVSGNVEDICGNNSVDTSFQVNIYDQTVEFSLPAITCENSSPLNLLEYVEGPLDGFFVGQGISGSQFNPAGLSGNVFIGYTVDSISECDVQPIFVLDTLFVSSIEQPIAFEPETDLFCISNDSVELLGGMPANGFYSGPGVINNSLVPSEVGVGEYIITYSISNVDGCVFSDDALITVDVCTEIESDFKQSMLLSPNPAGQHLTLFFREKMQTGSAIDFRIVDITGRIVICQTLSANSLQADMHIPVQNLPAGLYRVVLNTSGNTYSKPFVKL
jgi:hypothetical protein